jgi:hypothetical protein
LPRRAASESVDRDGSALWEKIYKWGFGILTIAALVAIAFLIAKGQDSDDELSFALRMPPAEFLYLDGPRILTYLEELEGGSVRKVHRISKEIRTASAEATLGQGKLGASTQRENAADSVLTRTEAGELGLLLSELRSNRSPGVSLHHVELNRPSDLANLEEGWLVRFASDDLLSPGYIRPYVVVHQSATLEALFPREVGNQASTERSELQREEAKRFSKRVGRNPRVIFAVSPPPPTRGASPLRIMLPMDYLGLTTERSLLEKDEDKYAGGKVVVIGKVIRVFESEGEDEDVAPEYKDWATREIWKNPLESASNYLIDHVSHSCVTPHTTQERKEIAEGWDGSPHGLEEAQKEKIEGRECFLVKLDRQTELYAPGALILPLAVYK